MPTPPRSVRPLPLTRRRSERQGTPKLLPPRQRPHRRCHACPVRPSFRPRRLCSSKGWGQSPPARPPRPAPRTRPTHQAGPVHSTAPPPPGALRPAAPTRDARRGPARAHHPFRSIDVPLRHHRQAGRDGDNFGACWTENTSHVGGACTDPTTSARGCRAAAGSDPRWGGRVGHPTSGLVAREGTPCQGVGHTAVVTGRAASLGPTDVRRRGRHRIRATLGLS
jgi:hypothetical protein